MLKTSVAMRPKGPATYARSRKLLIMRSAWLPFVALFALAVAGCGDNIEVGPGPEAKKDAKTETNQDLKAEDKPKADLAGLKKSSEAARAALAKAPTDKKIIQLASDTIYKEAEAVLVAPELEPKEKYPRALKLYREVVKLDPKNQGAKDSIKTIEDIYKSLGRPVPAG